MALSRAMRPRDHARGTRRALEGGSMATRPRVLVTGATGYIGGRLVPRLLERDVDVRCVARDPARLAGRPWPGVEIVRGDLSSLADAARALEGVDATYYLVHSMAGGTAYRVRDRAIARTFGAAAAARGVQKITTWGASVLRWSVAALISSRAKKSGTSSQHPACRWSNCVPGSSSAPGQRALRCSATSSSACRS